MLPRIEPNLKIRLLKPIIMLCTANDFQSMNPIKINKE